MHTFYLILEELLENITFLLKKFKNRYFINSLIYLDAV